MKSEKRVLFVADGVQQENFRGVLLEEGWEVVPADNVGEAFKATGPFDLLIVQVALKWDTAWLGEAALLWRKDLAVSGLAGVELASRLFKENVCPVIFLCSCPVDRAAVQQYRGGRFYPIMIPGLPSELMKVIRKLLEENKAV